MGGTTPFSLSLSLSLYLSIYTYIISTYISILGVYIYVCGVFLCMYVCIYIYRERERDTHTHRRSRQVGAGTPSPFSPFSLSIYPSIHTYIIFLVYVWVCVCVLGCFVNIYVCIDKYINILRELMISLREVGPSRKILHARGVGSERRKRVERKDGSWVALGTTRKIKIPSLISYFCRSRDRLFWVPVCALSCISFIFMVSRK